jgi:signal transduction histidine kinase
MPKRRWYRSLYSKIAIGYVVLLALLLLVQTSLAVWMTGRVWGGTTRTPAQLADLVAQDLSVELATDPTLDLSVYLRQKYGRGYRPFAVVLRTQEETFSNRPTMVPGNLGREARRAMIGFIYGDAARETGRGGEPARSGEARGSDSGRGADLGRGGDPGRGGGPGNGGDLGRGGRGGRGFRPFAEFADIMVNGTVEGTVAVPGTLPPLDLTIREIAPTLAWIGVALLGAGAGIMAFVIFRPTRRRLRSLEEAARALGEGRTDVRADERGGDEVSALSTTFNKVAVDLHARAEALAEADRARRQLLADVSHELMTPLSGIRGYIETLAMPELTLDDQTRRRYLAIVDEETHKLEAIIGDLLDLARLEGGGDTLDREPVLVDDLFRRVADRHQPQLRERGITLSTTTAAGTPLVFGDPDRLEQALQNVAANAIRHTPGGGTVSLRAEPDGNRVRITIADNGPGIPPEHLAHVFDRFYKADASRAGTLVPSGSGLGLSIVRAIVDRHGGEVRASNAPGGGAVFTFLLPSVAAGQSAVRS